MECKRSNFAISTVAVQRQQDLAKDYHSFESNSSAVRLLPVSAKIIENFKRNSMSSMS